MAMTAAEYFTRFGTGDTSMPYQNAPLPIAQALDSAAEQAITGLMTVLRNSQEHQARVTLLHRQPRLAGGFSSNKILLKNANAFEQMVAVSDWLAQTHIREIHTFFLSACNNE